MPRQISVFECFGRNLANSMCSEFIEAIDRNQAAFGVQIAGDRIERLADYYELVQEHNPILHLVAPCSPDEFATRHVLESLTLLEFLPENTRFADIGPGGGLPSIPCLLVRDDLAADLIESKLKKSAFLREAIECLSLKSRAKVIDRQFEEVEPGRVTAVTCRALDKFSEKLPRLIKWARDRRLLLFGGSDLKPAIEKHRKIVSQRLMPMSERRYLYLA